MTTFFTPQQQQLRFWSTYRVAWLVGWLVSFEFAFICGGPKLGLLWSVGDYRRDKPMTKPQRAEGRALAIGVLPSVSIVYRVSLKRRRSVLSSTEKIARRFDGILCFENAEIIQFVSDRFGAHTLYISKRYTKKIKI